MRRRLHVGLDQIHQSRLAITAAPAGSGKTTLLANWSASFPGPVAWYRADAVDVARLGLAGCVHAAVDAALQHHGTGLSEPSSGTDPARLGVDDVVRLIDRGTEPVLVVIDDAHLIGDAAADDLERLALSASRNLRLALGTRVLPSINLARTELGGLPAMITTDDLRFRSWEVEQLCRTVYGEPLPAGDAATLARRTDGWAAALALFHLATAGQSPDARRLAVHSLTSRPRYAQDYLAGEVLAGLTPALRTFLRRTSVFEVLTADRCDRLFGSGGVRGAGIAVSAQHALERIHGRHAYTVSDDGGRTFRHHEVLRRHLVTELFDELGEDDARAWYVAAAEVLEAEIAAPADSDATARPSTALEALLARCRGHDWTGMHRLLAADGHRIVVDDVDWAELVPAARQDDEPWILTSQARRLLADGRLDAAADAATRALDLFTDPVGQELSREVLDAARTWRIGDAAVGRTTTPSTWSDVVRAGVGRDPIGQLPAALRLGGVGADLAAGLLHVLAGDAEEAHVCLGRVVRSASKDQLTLATFARMVRATSAALIVDGAGGGEAMRSLDRACVAAEQLGLTWLTRVGRGVALVVEDTALARATAQDMAHDAAHDGDPWTAAVIRLALALRSLRLGTPDLPVLDALVGDLRALQAGSLEAWARSARALALAAADEPEAEQEAQAAESFARVAGVPGALALAYAALATTAPAGRAELTELAAATAESAGLPVRPWDWLRLDAAAGGAQITCFETFRIRLDGMDLPLDGVRPRARSLLRMLAVHAGGWVHRQRITQALWPELGDDAAMHNLQVAVSAVRKLLLVAGGVDGGPIGRAGGAIRIDREGDAYRLTAAVAVDYDVTGFAAGLSEAGRARARGDVDATAAALVRALALYAGDLLTEEGDAEWVSEPRERFRTQAAEASAVLAEIELARGDADAAADVARRGVQIDRWQDRSWRVLIEAHVERGDRVAAHRVEARYHAMLAELDLADD